MERGRKKEENQKNIGTVILVIIYLNLWPDSPEGKRDQAALAEPIQKPSSSLCPFSPHGNRFSGNFTIFIASIEGIITGHIGTLFLKQLLEGEGQGPKPEERTI